MHAQRPLLPLYQASEEYFEEVPELDISSSSPSDSIITALSSVLVDENAHSSPPAAQLVPSDKKQVKFAEVDVANIHIYRPADLGGEPNCNQHYPDGFPYRASYGTINPLPSILRDPRTSFPVKMSKEESLYNSTHGTTQTETRKLRTRIRLQNGFNHAEIRERQKISPLICLLASFFMMLLLFIWFLTGGDSHAHKHNDYEFGEEGATSQH